MNCFLEWTSQIMNGPALFRAGIALGLVQAIALQAAHPPGPLSVSAARQLAAERNWDLLAAAAGVDMATAQKIVSREFPNPTASLSSTMINVDHHPSSTPEGNGL